MASSSSSPSGPSVSPQLWKYHVFLSFRGEDTRKTFVDHLYSALEQQGIYTYKDDETLPRGEVIGPSLKKSIEESQIAVVVFSENYASSSWCLDELACIVKCKDTKGQIVMPIFYDVDPSEVRKQKRKYGEAFAKHEIENTTNVESWREAIVAVSNISGWEPKHIANGHESKVIKEIVDTISQRLRLVTSSANEDLVGVVARVQGLKSELRIGLGGVRMIGIWGVGGGGKTTLVSSVYDEFSSMFDGCCFVKDIREESSKRGLEKLQEKILSGVLKQKQVQEIGRVEEGKRMIRDRLCHKKVLIVLDDVNRLDQLKALAGSHNWYGEGSRIIITTRDEHVLNAIKVDVKHNISLLNEDEAMKLFCKHARPDCTPTEDGYEQLSKEVVSYARGLPLALTVIGSFFCDKDIHEWRSALARLKEIPNDNILERLKISFDGLTKDEKELFLDIACFHRLKKKDKAMRILEACGLHPGIGVKVLIQKALITISDGRFNMHDLVQEMGQYIVRGELQKNLEKHSRVWKEEDLVKVCDMSATKELDKIEAIFLKLPKFPEDRQILDSYLIASNLKNLRYIKWIGFDQKPFVDINFPPKELCYLKLYGGPQKQLWEGGKMLLNLKILEFGDLFHLIMTPDFDGLPNLERLRIKSCYNLKEIHQSIRHLENLVFISIERCESLNMCPPITGLTKLETLSFPSCKKLLTLSEIEIQQNMDHLPFLPHNNMNHIRFQFFPNLQELSLRKLDLRDCKLGDEDMVCDVWELPNLQELNLGSNEFSRLSFTRFPRLKWLDVSYCSRLVGLSKLPSSIAIVLAYWCESLESIGDISKCKWLWKVMLRGADNMDPLDGEILLDSMLQGNAIQDHFICVQFPHQIPKGFVGRIFSGNTFTKRIPHVPFHSRRPRPRLPNYTFTLRLPDDWYNDFCGCIMRVVTKDIFIDVDMTMKQKLDEDSQIELWQESNDAPEPEYYGKMSTYVGYVSFGLLRRTTLLNSSYNIISFSINTDVWTTFAAELVPRSKDDPMQTTKVATDTSEFWNDIKRNSITIKHDSKTSIKIHWEA